MTKGERDVFCVCLFGGLNGGLTPSCRYALTASDIKDGHRSNSVRDRMRQFSEPSPSGTDAALKKAAASLRTSGDGPAGPVGGSASHTSRTQSLSKAQATPPPRASSPASQSQEPTGGTSPPEKGFSQDDGTPGRAAGQQVAQGEEEPDMKTFLTIEIKDGRATPSSTPTPQGDMLPITSMGQHVTSSALGQRAGRGWKALTLHGTP